MTWLIPAICYGQALDICLVCRALRAGRARANGCLGTVRWNWIYREHDVWYVYWISQLPDVNEPNSGRVNMRYRECLLLPVVRSFAFGSCSIRSWLSLSANLAQLRPRPARRRQHPPPPVYPVALGLVPSQPQLSTKSRTLVPTRTTLRCMF